ncbi:MAG: aminotransferase class V-fold PLP-dependent enzyme [Oligoflexia bacterium]|nr:aminotransferase class V-fold PLP-dependent enzyme [Oligoflexia bacterium]
MIYLDHAASTPIIYSALKVYNKSLVEDYANSSSKHLLGANLNKRVEEVRKYFLSEVHANANGNGNANYSLIFTSSATESNNMIINSLDKNGFIKEGEGNIVYYSKADHPSITAAITNIFGKKCDCDFRDISSFVDEDADKIKLVILSQVNNHSGKFTDVCDATRKIKKINPNVFIHVDAAQGFGKFKLDLSDGNIDSVTTSSHKMGGPKGVALLYYQKKFQKKTSLPLWPLLWGGEQESGYRSSSVNAPAIFSFQEAYKWAKQNMQTNYDNIYKINLAVRKSLSENRIKFPLQFPFALSECSPYILTMIAPNVPADILQRHLEEKNIFVSTTSACSSKKKSSDESQKLLYNSLNIPLAFHKNVLRVSFGFTTTESEVDQFINDFNQIYNDLLKIF